MSEPFIDMEKVGGVSGQPMPLPEAPQKFWTRNRIIGGVVVAATVAAIGIGEAVSTVLNRIDETSTELAEVKGDLGYKTRLLDDTSHRLHVAEGQLRTTQTRQDKSEARTKRLADIIGQDKNINRKTIEGSTLKAVPSLERADAHVNINQANLVKNSMVAILSRPKDSNENWHTHCSGAKIAPNLILTARHCLDISGFTYMSSDAPAAAEVSSIESEEYMIANPHYTSNQKNNSHYEPVAYVTDESVAVTNTVTGVYSPDIAMLKVEPVKNLPKGVRPFSRLEELPVENTAKPNPGEPVVGFSFPSAVSKVAVKRHLRFIGSDRDSSYTPRNPIDILASTASLANKDNIQHGGSGSFAIGASGYVYGPLSTGFQKAFQYNLPSSIDEEEGPSTFLKNRFNLEEEYEIDLSPYSKIGNMTRRPKAIVEKLKQGFAKPVLSFAKRSQ